MDRLYYEQELSRNNLQPHDYLGMKFDHENQRIIVRVFCKDAKNIEVHNKKVKDRTYPLTEIGDGLFEGVMGKCKKEFPYILRCEGWDGKFWEMEDPYAYPAIADSGVISGFQNPSYSEGYKWLGGHVMEHDGVQGVQFTIWSPNAKRVSVIGDFNNWNGERHILSNIGHTNVYSIFIPNLTEADRYEYEIKTQSNDLLYKCDPYGRHFAMRPSRHTLPYNQNRYQWNDEQYLQKIKGETPVNQPISIYELHISSWRKPDGHSLTYRSLAEPLIEYMKWLNFTHVEFMGILEHPFDGSWGYQVTGYFAPTNRYGSPDDFKYLIDQLHQNNIGVILDWVPAHFPIDDFALECLDGCRVYEREGLHPDWNTLMFDYGRREIKNFLISSATMWLNEYHMDGIRVDAVASILYGGNLSSTWADENAVNFLKEINFQLKSMHPEKIIIAEDSSTWHGVTTKVEDHGLGFDFKWCLGWMHDCLDYLGTDFIYRRHHHDEITFSLSYMNAEKYMLALSHDEVVHGKSPLIYKMWGDWWQQRAGLKLCYGYMFAHPGKKLLFMGSEFAQTSEWDEKSQLDWHLTEFDDHKQIMLFTKDLNEVYVNSPALYHEEKLWENFEWINGDNLDTLVVSFIRKTQEQELVIVLNFSQFVYENYPIGVNKAGTYKEILNSDDWKYGGTGRVNHEVHTPEGDGWNWKENKIEVVVPPLSIMIFEHKPNN
ncbi:MAG: hypothetical protein ATN36_07640 [Epulopiscium sp. Nele67-Bin005]|nr:MAG: hypothetical protein ATN36_07640 [Epulopiscium sp. Nele67-Bin005]